MLLPQQLPGLNYGHFKHIDQDGCFRLIEHLCISDTLKAINMGGDSETNSMHVREIACLHQAALLCLKIDFLLCGQTCSKCMCRHCERLSVFMCMCVSRPTGGDWLTECECINCVFSTFLLGWGLQARPNRALRPVLVLPANPSASRSLSPLYPAKPLHTPMFSKLSTV